MAWFSEHGASGWASCPITQNGCVRIIVYLLALAVQHGGRLVTFDGTIAMGAVRGAGKKHLVRL